MKALLLRNAALRRLPFWTLIAFFATQAVYGVAAAVGARTDLSWRILLLAVNWMMLTEYLQLAQIRQRASLFDLGLPLSTKRLWYTSLLGSYISALAVLGTLFSLLMLGYWIFSSLGAPIDISFRDAALLFVLMAAALLPATVWAHGRRPELATAPRGWRHFVSIWILNVPLFGLMLLMRDAPQMFVPVALVLGAVLLIQKERRIPEVLSVAPREATEGPTIRTNATVRPRPMGVWRRSLAIYEIAYRTAPRGITLIFIAVPLLVLLGWALSGAVAANGPDFELRFLFIAMSIYMGVTTTAPLLQNLKLLDPLPISRRRLFSLFCLPMLLSLGLGYVGGAVWMAGRTVPDPSLLYVEEEPYWGLRVPRSLWRLSLDGDVPPQVSPEGEAHPPMALSVVPGLPSRLWKPYTTPVDASLSYVEWQTARALSDLYGAEVATSELAGRFYRTDAGGRVRRIEADPDFLSVRPDLSPAQRGHHAPALFLLIGVPGFLCLAYFAPRVRAGTSKTRRTIYLWIPLGVLLAVHIAQFMMPVFTGTGLWILESAHRCLVDRLLTAVPGGVWGAWLFSLLAVWASFEAALRSFGRTESLVDNSSCLWDAVVKAD